MRVRCPVASTNHGAAQVDRLDRDVRRDSQALSKPVTSVVRWSADDAATVRRAARAHEGSEDNLPQVRGMTMGEETSRLRMGRALLR